MKKINSIISLSFLVIFLLVSNVNSSSDWKVYSIDNDWNVYSYMKGNIDKDGGQYIVQVSVKKFFSDRGREKEIQDKTEKGLLNKGYEKLSDEISLNEIDCKNREIRTLHIYSNDKDGNVLFFFDKKTEWMYIPPDSREEKLLKEVCK